jgi:hypothetical protein
MMPEKLRRIILFQIKLSLFSINFSDGDRQTLLYLKIIHLHLGGVMPRQKRSSKVLEDAQQRAVNLKTIDANLELNPSLTLGNFSAEIEQLQVQLDAYNSLLTQIDVAKSEISESEQRLKHLSTDMLTGVATKYGRDSYEYKMAGGTRRSERKRPIRKLKVSL